MFQDFQLALKKLIPRAKTSQVSLNIHKSKLIVIDVHFANINNVSILSSAPIMFLNKNNFLEGKKFKGMIWELVILILYFHQHKVANNFYQQKC